MIEGSKAGIEALIQAYLDWCSLLGLKVTKVQVWSSLGPGQSVTIGQDEILTSPSFRFVGVEVGLPEPEASRVHLGPRVTKALATVQRLRALQLPSSLCSLLWRTTVLPQALYGCEVRDLRQKDLNSLAQAGKAAIVHKFPLRLNEWRAEEVVMRLPLGESAVSDAMGVVRMRQLSWLQVLVNSLGVAGVVH